MKKKSKSVLQKSRQFYKIICKTTIHTLHLIIHDKKEERKKYTYIQVFEADINDALGHKKMQSNYVL